MFESVLKQHIVDPHHQSFQRAAESDKPDRRNRAGIQVDAIERSGAGAKRGIAFADYRAGDPISAKVDTRKIWFTLIYNY